MKFFIFTRTFFLDETKTIAQKCLVNELVFFFGPLKGVPNFNSIQ